MSFVLYTQILKQSVLKPASPGITLSVLSAFIWCNFHVYKWEKVYIKDLNAWRFLMNFLCIYLDEGKGVALMHVYVLEHIVSLSYRTAW